MNNQEEIWKDILGYEGLYMVSSLGNVKSLYKNILLKQAVTRQKYKFVFLSKNGNGKGFLVHRLVAFSFIINIENKPFINHINGIKDDNRIENLEWCTFSENMIHGYKIGLYKPYWKNKFGKNACYNKGIVKQYNSSMNLIAEYECSSVAARLLGISENGINKVCRGERKIYKNYYWKRMTKD